MSYLIKNIRLLVRETKPARFALSLGKKAQGAAPPPKTTSPLCHVHLELQDDQGRKTFGCSADRLSVRWLDKRPQRTKTTKLRELVTLLETARAFYLEKPSFETPFEHWLTNHARIMEKGKMQGQEDLTSTYVSSLYERALIDGVCRLAGRSLLEMLASDALGFKPSRIHPAVTQDKPAAYLPARLNAAIDIRHTVGFFDPLDETDWPASKRLNDGLPETLSEIIKTYGIRYFKVKVSGNPAADLKRLSRVWGILPHAQEPVVTLDANEAFEDPQEFVAFLKQLQRDQLGLFQHISFIEQPFPRRISLAPETGPAIQAASQLKPLVIDESDATLDAFPRAVSLGYSGTSHKNCKGIFKSLANRALMLHYLGQQKNLFMSAEDLQNLPIVPLQQDLAMVSILGITHCERNGHHYNRGLSMLSPADKASVARHHRDLYEQRGGEWYLKVRDGQVRINSLFGPGFAVRDEPDWQSMVELRKWVDQRYPA
ncbi:MAG: hypothetical protein ABGX05_17635 [Pirellulaceae bacterium]